MFFAALASGMFDLPGGSGMVMLFFGDLNTNIRNLPCLRKLGPSKHLDLPMSFFSNLPCSTGPKDNQGQVG